MKFHFNQFELDTERLELKAGTKLVAVEPQVFSLLVFLIENREHVVSRDDIIEAVWQGRIVSDATVSTRINAARRAVGDDGTTQAVIQTLPRRGFRFVAEVSKERHEGEEANAPAPLSNHQTVKFCQTPDGVNIAYATSGSGPCLLKTTSWLNHLEYDWKSPVWRSMLENLSRDHELIRYDQRGNGLSDWDIEGYSLEAMTLDMQTVLDDHGAETYDIFAISQGCAVAVNYAVENPDKVSRLILYGGYTRGVLRRGNEKDHAKEEALKTLIREGWGQDNPAFRQIFTSLLMPDANAEQMAWFNDLQREASSPENAVKLRDTIDEMDITDLLPQVTQPTLVIHRKGDARQPFEEGRRLASLIPNAQFVALEGRNHAILDHEPEWAELMGCVHDFLKP